MNEAAAHQLEIILAIVAVASALVGLGVAYWLYIRQPGKPEQLAKSMKPVYNTLLNKYYVDELYAAVIIKPLMWISTNVLWKGIDVAGIDGTVNGIATGATSNRRYGPPHAIRQHAQLCRLGRDRRARGHRCHLLLALGCASHRDGALMPSGPLLSILIFLPAIGALALLFLRSDDQEWIRRLAFAVSLAEFILSLWWLLRGVPLGSAGYQLEEFHRWIAIGPHSISPQQTFAQTYINYHLGVDGISLFLVILTTFLTVISILCSWSSIQKRVKEFFIAILLLEVGVVGVFLSLDLFLFFLFWEVMLIPMYLLIGIWGHDRRIYAAVKFILYTMAGSIFMLVGILWLYNATGSFRPACHSAGPPIRLASASSRHGNASLPRVFRSFRHQSSALPVPHLAA